MVVSQARSGYTLPVFATAAAIAALHYLRQPQRLQAVSVDLIEPAEIVEIPIEQVAGLKEGMALAIARSDPGDNLDLTRDTPIWALVEWQGRVGEWGSGRAGERESGRVGEWESGRVGERESGRVGEWESGRVGERESGRAGDGEIEEVVVIKGGEGIGIHAEGGQPAIYAYARRLLRENLERLLQPGEKIQVTIILPEGRQLAQRTSNAAFGVVEGLSLLGTSGISQPLSAPGQLDAALEELREKAKRLRRGGDGESGRAGERESGRIFHVPCPTLVFCIGENGLDLTRQLGIDPDYLVKTANWLGPLLVEAGLQQVPSLLLFGYHGKLIKLAGGIFHTHHHLADGRLEILTAHCAQLGLPTPHLQQVFASATAEDALKSLRELDASTGSHWVNRVYGAIAETIDQRSQAYIRKHSEQDICVGSILFDRDRQMIVKSKSGALLLSQLC